MRRFLVLLPVTAASGAPKLLRGRQRPIVEGTGPELGESKVEDIGSVEEIGSVENVGSVEEEPPKKKEEKRVYAEKIKVKKDDEISAFDKSCNTMVRQ